MSSSLWSNTSDRSSSSLSWEEQNDETSENYLQNIIETIDGIVFSNEQIPEHLSTELAEECRLWRQKFAQKFEKPNDRKPSKLKSLSASKTEQINVSHNLNTRSLSERRSSTTRFVSIPKLNNRNDISNGKDRQLITNPKPIILPPLVNVSHMRRIQNQTNHAINASKVPNITQMRTSFPKPAPVLSLEHLLSQSQNSMIEENGTKFPIVLHSNNYGKSQHKTNDMSRSSALPFIHK